MSTDQSKGDGPSPAPKVELMEALGLRIRVTFPDFLALSTGEPLPAKDQSPG